MAERLCHRLAPIEPSADARGPERPASSALASRAPWIAVAGSSLVPFVLVLASGTAGASSGSAGLFLVLQGASLALALVTVSLATFVAARSRHYLAGVLATALLIFTVFGVARAAVVNGGLAPVAPLTSFLPYSWAFSRGAALAVIAVCCGLALLRRDGLRSVPMPGVWTWGATVLAASITLLVWSSTTPTLPGGYDAQGPIFRPLELGPLLMYGLVGRYYLWPLHRREPSPLSRGMLASLVPGAVAQLHMAFGSRALFDAHFLAAHGLELASIAFALAGVVGTLTRSTSAELRVDCPRVGHDLEIAAAQLEAANRVLTQRNREVDEFTYIVSHDLQAPLRKLVAFSEFLKADAGDDLPERAGEDLQYIVGAADRAQRLIDDLLSLSRAGRRELDPQALDTDRLVDQALANLSAELHHSDARIHREPLPPTFADRRLATLVFELLIANAVHFAREGREPRIRIGAVDNGDEVVFEVRDAGIGIERRHLSKVFAPCTRIGASDTSSGSGMGLAICRRVIGRHGGRIWIESEFGEGTSVYFTLPSASAGGAVGRVGDAVGTAGGAGGKAERMPFVRTTDD